MVDPIISCDATKGYKKQHFAPSCDGKMDELFIHFIKRTVKHAELFRLDRSGSKLKIH